MDKEHLAKEINEFYWESSLTKSNIVTIEKSTLIQYLHKTWMTTDL